MVASSSLLHSLPHDLLTEEIFLRLPSISLLRCKSVCKEWYNIISSPSFIDKHYNHETNRARLLLYQTTFNVYDAYGKPVPSSYLYYPDVDTCERHQAPDNLVLWGDITFVRGPCNGIFCIHSKENRFALWNPTIRSFRPILCSPSYKFDEVGFGVDPNTGDFKIVLIRSLIRISPCFAIYTSSNHSWRYLEQESLGDPGSHIPTHASKPDNFTFLNGTYYWMIRNKFLRCLAILAFDMHNEIFQQMETPETIGGEFGASLHLLNDSLALVSSKGYDTEIWLLEEKGYWTKFLSVIIPVENACLYGLWGGNKILLRIRGEHELVMCDLDSHSSKLLSVEKGRDERFQAYLSIHYKESLASVKGEHGIEDYDTRSEQGLKFLGYVGPYTEIDRFVHREAQIGTEEEEALRDHPGVDYPDWRDLYATHHPYVDGEVAQLGKEEVLRCSCIPYDPYFYNDEDYLHQPGMVEDRRHPYANDHPGLDSEGNLRQPAMEKDPYAEYHSYLDAGYQHPLLMEKD